MAGGAIQAGRSARGKIINEINITPFVDVMLVLLIIFMVTATFIDRDSLDVKLPEASTGEPRKPTVLAITIDAAGKLGLNGVESNDNTIRQFIRERKKSNEELEAVIAADKRVAHGEVVRVIDLVRAEGVVNFAINVLKPANR